MVSALGNSCKQLLHTNRWPLIAHRLERMKRGLTGVHWEQVVIIAAFRWVMRALSLVFVIECFSPGVSPSDCRSKRLLPFRELCNRHLPAHLGTQCVLIYIQRQLPRNFRNPTSRAHFLITADVKHSCPCSNLQVYSQAIWWAKK